MSDRVSAGQGETAEQPLDNTQATVNRDINLLVEEGIVTMSVKDRYGNNLRREAKVRDLRPEMKQDGVVVGTADSGKGSSSVYVRWEDGTEETIRSTDLLATETAFGGRRRNG